MKEWSNKPSSLVQASSSPVKTVSATRAAASQQRLRDISCLTKTGSSPVKTTSAVVKSSSSPFVQTSSSLVRTSAPLAKMGSSSVALTNSSSGTLIPASSSKIGGASLATGAAVVTPLVTGTVVGGIAAVFYGVSNMIKYGEHKKTGAQAAKDTVKGSAGLGVSAGLSVAAAKAIAGTALALGSTVVVPITAGIATAYISMKTWNKLFFKKPDTLKAKAKTKSKTK